MGSFFYLIGQGIRSTWRNRVMSFASIGILTACLVLVGCTGLVALNVHDAFKRVENQTEMVVYIKDDAAQPQIERLGVSLEEMDGVARVEYISKSDAITIQKESLGEKGYLIDGLGEFLPAAYKVYVDNIENMAPVKDEISGLDDILEIYVPDQLVEVLTGFKNVVTVLGGILVGILVIASIVVINNTIRMTVYSQRREINIMKYVGATNTFIRLPYFIEGLNIGLWSGALAFGILAGVYKSINRMLSESPIGWLHSIQLYDFWEVWPYVLAGFAVVGMLIGSFASSSATRKHLKV